MKICVLIWWIFVEHGGAGGQIEFADKAACEIGLAALMAARPAVERSLFYFAGVCIENGRTGA